MFAKVILFSAIVSSVYVQSIDSCESGTLSPPGTLRLDDDMNARSTKTIEQKLVPKTEEEKQQVLRTLPAVEKPNTPPQSTIKPTTVHELVHAGMKHPKKRATNYEEDRKADLRPGCCG